MRFYILGLALVLPGLAMSAKIHSHNQHAHSGANEIAPNRHQHPLPQFSPNMNRQTHGKEAVKNAHSFNKAHPKQRHYSHHG